MTAFRTLVLAWVALSATACGRRAAPRVAARPTCPSAWGAAWSSDSSIAVCLPSGFAAASGAAHEGHGRWERRPAWQAVGDWLSVSLDTTAAPPPAALWPRHLASGPGCLADCATADSVAAYRDAVEGGTTVAEVEVGLVSGGMPGFRRQPALVAGWATREGRRIWVNGLAERPGTLDTLRAMLRTVRVAGPS